MAQRLGQCEKQLYRKGGACRAPRPRQAGSDHAQLDAAIRILRAWGARARAIRASLAIASPQTYDRWRRGKGVISLETLERITVIVALHHHLSAGQKGLRRRQLPALRRAGRPALSGKAVLAEGRLSDLLGLWRQVVLSEEAAARRSSGKRPSSGRSRRPS